MKYRANVFKYGPRRVQRVEISEKNRGFTEIYLTSAKVENIEKRFAIPSCFV